MLPPLKTIKNGLHRTTEALAAELAKPGTPTPDWNALEWRLASVSAVVHGVSPLLSQRCTWQAPDWQPFLAAQCEHVEQRHRRVATLLQQIDLAARSAGVAIVPLKGSALHAMGLYVPGERPMADIDLLVREADAAEASRLLQDLCYVESFNAWKHRVFKPHGAEPRAVLGEHRDTPINVELHIRIQERLPVSPVDISGRVHPSQPHAGLNAYPSTAALMSHLLLHAAGNICNRSFRLLHMHDIALLSTRMTPDDWHNCLDERLSGPAWWALPPLTLVARYYQGVVPEAVLERLHATCPSILRIISRHQTLTQVSCSDLWLHAFSGIEWSRSLTEVTLYLRNRIRPPQGAVNERNDMARTQLWLRDQPWVTAPQKRRVLTWLTQPVPRMDTMYAVRAALEPSAA
ncbi:nucleotidyltransferase family protein [Dyella amyloliquefaciens]|uniref:nucleotidyltransferase family protein n=1 Tax=Dyella amyloliquefaciens TaxID=1770545 RepID=UPI00102EA12A|nr:nucleotidyltransferase family protein [Dyella amyloliquefaciens]